MEGMVNAAEYRQGVTPFLSREEQELSIMQALIRINTRMTMGPRIGRPLYSLTEYEMVTKATMLVNDPSSKFGVGEFVIILSIEKHVANPCGIVKEKVIPFVQKMVE